jgi:predicted nucleic acid-binding protein
MNDRSFVDSNIWLYAFVLRPAYGVAEKVSSSSSAVSSIGFLFFFGGLNNEYSDS